MSRNWKDAATAELFSQLYGARAEKAAERFLEAESRFFSYFGEGAYRVFSAPGRSEIGGNHTDHNYGKVLACAVSLDTVAFVRPTDNKIVRYRSAGYRGEKEFRVDLSNLAVVEKEKASTNALIRGVADRMTQLGFAVGGFDMYVTSDVLRGSGLSSSAAFEVMTAAVLDGLYNKGQMDAVARAQIAQYAENVHFGKPSGLMDQTASSVGGLVTIDFEDPAKPIVEKVPFDFTSTGLSLVVVDTGGNHANLTDAYASITLDMAEVSHALGAEKLRQVGKEKFFNRLASLHGKVSDRALLRAIHFFHENDRVDAQVNALKSGDVAAFLKNVQASGESSWKYLQNLYVAGSCEQGLPLALAVSQPMLDGVGAYRVHGGGFAGTILAFVPGYVLRDYATVMRAVFGENAVTILSVRNQGAIEIPVP